MQFFSGFCLSNEEELFKEYLQNSIYEVAGFSYGAIKAFEYALNSKTRIDKLTLLSPAFFQNQDKRYKRLQLLHFKKDATRYIENFLKNISYPCKKDLKHFLKPQGYEELNELLNYTWQEDKLKLLTKKGIDIQIHLGALDKIITTKDVYEFFKPYATIYYYKDKGHILCKP